jgi:hypothetical protein
MRSLSPSSRLVLAVVLIALVILVIGRALAPPTPGTAAGSPSAGSKAANASTGASSSPTVLPSTNQTASASASTTPTGPITPTPAPTTTGGCTPTDQDQYVYNPRRLAIQAACIRITGTVAAVRTEADGDLHILLALDPADTHLLTPANQGVELGDLVVEPVCVRGVSQADAIETCATDPDPLPGPYPSVGDHVWMEGRYVLDLEHGSWAELHPLYRWGTQ